MNAAEARSVRFDGGRRDDQTRSLDDQNNCRESVKRPRVTEGPARDVELRTKRVFELIVEVDGSFRLLVSFDFLRIVSSKVVRDHQT
jgi:hypothetical protein